MVAAVFLLYMATTQAKFVSTDTRKVEDQILKKQQKNKNK